jgi:hypothetical protein
MYPKSSSAPIPPPPVPPASALTTNVLLPELLAKLTPATGLIYPSARADGGCLATHHCMLWPRDDVYRIAQTRGLARSRHVRVQPMGIKEATKRWEVFVRAETGASDEDYFFNPAVQF